VIKTFSLDENDCEIVKIFDYKNNEVIYLDNSRTGIFSILNILPKGEVILPAYICNVVVSSVIQSGHKPVFVDIDYEENLSMPIIKIKEKISLRTRAIIAAHIFGIPCNIIDHYQFAKENGILLIEDAAAGLGGYIQGRPLGIFGDVSVFSFGKGKPLWINKGGLLLINNKDIKDILINSLTNLRKASSVMSLFTALINKILYHPYIYHLAYKIKQDRMGVDFWEDGISDNIKIKFNLMDSFTKKLIYSQHDSWKSKLVRRGQTARAYREKICNPRLRHLEVSDDREPSWPCYPLLVNRRKSFFHYMHNRGIDLSWSWNYNSAEIFGQADCPNTSYIAKRILSLPTHSNLCEQDADYIIKIANDFS
jgi:dTDP-4-amino-4,6-dideoxygalactose transaminase